MRKPRDRYEILLAGEWINVLKGDPQDKWLHYELTDGTIGLKRPGNVESKG